VNVINVTINVLLVKKNPPTVLHVLI